jgi:BirA family transcriptional regulator, biotin operon repressor / biotin---[acetyl-CoA-carboxylase] ligase
VEIIYRHFACLTSTNDWAKAHLNSCPRDKLSIITADSQTAGRGRYGRRWVSCYGSNIYATFVFFEESHDQIKCEKSGLRLTHLLALSASSLLQILGVATQIKWPNDLVVEQKKIGGILCETTADATLLGIGINVNMTPVQLSTIDQPATSLLCQTGVSHSVPSLVKALAEQFASDLVLYCEKGFSPFAPLFHERLL